MIQNQTTNTAHFSQGVFKTAIEMSQAEKILPSTLITLVISFNKIHRIWRFFRLKQIYSNPDNFLKLTAGHGVNSLFGDSMLLKISALCVLVATRILDCVDQLSKVQNSWKKFISAYKGHYPNPIKSRWKKEFSWSLAKLNYWARKLIERIQRILRACLNLIKESFILSMRFTDAIETFYLSPQTRNEGVNLFFLNSAKWIDELSKNREKLVEQLQENSFVIDKILKGIHSPLSSPQLIKSVESALEKTAHISNTLETVSETSGRFFSALIKNWAHEALGFFNLQHLVPPSAYLLKNSEYSVARERYYLN